MEKSYWLGRASAAIAMAKAAASSRARLIHYELAGRHALKAVGEIKAAPEKTEPR